MNQKRVKNLSFTFKNDFFNEIKTEKEASSLNLTPKASINANCKYTIKSSLFQDKSESANDFEVSTNEDSTNISEVKRNEYSLFSRFDDSDKSGKNSI